VSRETHYVYADGSCLGNPGPGGWAAVIVKPGGVSSMIYKRRRQTSGPASGNRHGRQSKRINRRRAMGNSEAGIAEERSGYPTKSRPVSVKSEANK
jgi:hypothetical protein